MDKHHLSIFEGKKIRSVWDKKTKKEYFSVVDAIEILTDNNNPEHYWFEMNNRVERESGIKLAKICLRLKMRATDGKLKISDAADSELLLRIIQSIPSKKAEPFKLWLAKVGNERLLDLSDPERSLNRARDYWQRMGRSEKWIQQRMMSQETRNKLTDYWKTHEVNEQNEYAILTNIIHEEWSNLSVREHKKFKNLKRENLRDHMTEAELIFTTLAEFSTRQISEKLNSVGFIQNKIPAKKGGRIAKIARLELEKRTGKSIISSVNYISDRKKIT